MNNIFKQIIELLQENYKTFLQGLGTTLLLAIVGTFVGLFIGIFIALVRNLNVNKNDNWFIKTIKYIGKGVSFAYITVLRGTPMMVQAMLIYFGGRTFNFWNSTDLGSIFIDGHLVCGLVVITLNTAAYMAENVRAGINSIDKGQMEASRSLGMSYFQTMIHIIIPQALKNAIPNIGNEFIVNIKDSSVLNVISVTELYLSVGMTTATNYYIIAGYTIVACIYLILTVVSTIILKAIEKALDDKRKTAKIFINATGV